MKEREFSNWVNFNNRAEIQDKNWKFPGIYAIAYSKKDLSNQKFNLLENIVYFGMTNSISGLRGRLKQFETTIYLTRDQHGGANRFIYSLSKEDGSWINRLYVSVMYFKCDVTTNNPNDLLVMGDVLKQEFICFSDYAKKFKKLPRFNDKKASPKKEKK